MRLKNVKGAKERINISKYIIISPFDNKGNYKSLFGNTNPIHLEIGTGKGDFIVKMAETFPNINFIGIEKYSSVLLRAIQKMEQEPLDNVYFIRMDAEAITEVFGREEVDRIYLNFSDPWPKDRHAKRRLPSRQFLARYDEILNPAGDLEFKTDNKDLFTFAEEEVAETKWEIRAITYDLHNDSKMCEGNVMTEYEEKFSSKGNPIYKYIIGR